MTGPTPDGGTVGLIVGSLSWVGGVVMVVVLRAIAEGGDCMPLEMVGHEAQELEAMYLSDLRSAVVQPLLYRLLALAILFYHLVEKQGTQAFYPSSTWPFHHLYVVEELHRAVVVAFLRLAP